MMDRYFGKHKDDVVCKRCDGRGYVPSKQTKLTEFGFIFTGSETNE